jgi:hypothetical protein
LSRSVQVEVGFERLVHVEVGLVLSVQLEVGFVLLVQNITEPLSVFLIDSTIDRVSIRTRENILLSVSVMVIESDNVLERAFFITSLIVNDSETTLFGDFTTASVILSVSVKVCVKDEVP